MILPTFGGSIPLVLITYPISNRVGMRGTLSKTTPVTLLDVLYLMFRENSISSRRPNSQKSFQRALSTTRQSKGSKAPIPTRI